MTSHVWQFLLTDEDQRVCLARIREHLDADGRFAFETRAHPLGAEFGARHTKRFKDASGRAWSLEASSQFDADTSIDSSVLTYTAMERGDPTTVRNRLRFTPVSQLDERLRWAGLRVVERYGNWDRTQYDEESPEIITIAARL